MSGSETNYSASEIKLARSQCFEKPKKSGCAEQQNWCVGEEEERRAEREREEEEASLKPWTSAATTSVIFSPLKTHDLHYEGVFDKASRITHYTLADITSRLFP